MEYSHSGPDKTYEHFDVGKKVIYCSSINPYTFQMSIFFQISSASFSFFLFFFWHQLMANCTLLCTGWALCLTITRKEGAGKQFIWRGWGGALRERCGEQKPLSFLYIFFSFFDFFFGFFFFKQDRSLSEREAARSPRR